MEKAIKYLIIGQNNHSNTNSVLVHICKNINTDNQLVESRNIDLAKILKMNASKVSQALLILIAQKIVKRLDNKTIMLSPYIFNEHISSRKEIFRLEEIWNYADYIKKQKKGNK